MKSNLNPPLSQSIKQNINKHVAYFLSNNPNASIDEVLLAAAPPIVRDVRTVPSNELNRIMRKIKFFIKHRPSFQNYTKDAIVEGLKIEWLPNIETEEKISMLENLAVIEKIEDDGTIITNKKVFDTFADLYRELSYGIQPYRLPRSFRKPKVTSLEPDKNLTEKLQPYIQWYRRWLHKRFMFEHEGYKWVATAHFKTVIDNIEKINKGKLSVLLKEALKASDNLLTASHYYAESMLINAADIDEQDVRSALLMLFDENLSLAERADKFIEQMKDIVASNRGNGKIGLKDTSQQDMHAVSVYLSFMYPNRHYIFKSSIWYAFHDIVGLDYPSLSIYTHRLVGYEDLCNHIKVVLLQDEDLIKTHDKIYNGVDEEYNGKLEKRPKDISDYHLLTQDFIYAIGEHFVDWEKNPAHFEKGQDLDWI